MYSIRSIGETSFIKCAFCQMKTELGMGAPEMKGVSLNEESTYHH
jgi:hypothetical protein